MHLSNPRKSAAGTCLFCHDKAGTLSREHPECRRVHQVGWNETITLTAGGESETLETRTETPSWEEGFGQ